MGARGSKPVTATQLEKMSPEQQRIAAQKVLAANASKKYKAGWWAPKSGNATLKNAKNAARLKLSQLELREKQRELKDKIAEAKLDLDQAKLDLEHAKDDFQKAKKKAATAGANQNSRNARNDAEDEVDKLEDKIHDLEEKIHDLEKDLRNIRKQIDFKDKTYRSVIKPVLAAVGSAAQAVAIPTLRAGQFLSSYALAGAIKAYKATRETGKAINRAILAEHYRSVISSLETHLKRGINVNGKGLTDETRKKLENELSSAKDGLERITKGADITPAQVAAAEPPLFATKNRNNGIKAGNRLRTANAPGRAHTKVVNANLEKVGIQSMINQMDKRIAILLAEKKAKANAAKANAAKANAAKQNNNNFGPFQTASPPPVTAAKYIAAAAANAAKAAEKKGNPFTNSKLLAKMTASNTSSKNLAKSKVIPFENLLSSTNDMFPKNKNKNSEKAGLSALTEVANPTTKGGRRTYRRRGY